MSEGNQEQAIETREHLVVEIKNRYQTATLGTINQRGERTSLLGNLGEKLLEAAKKV